jgi:alginate O-acetyltransferase complex protein AlgJ
VSTLELPASRYDGKVLRGKDGWLFLDGDTNYIMRQHTGELRFSDEELRHWQLVLENRVSWLAERGAPYHFLVAPNPHSVYWDKLPDGSGDGAGRSIIQLIEHLESERSPARILYPIETLSARRDEHIYARTNTHWSDFGAFIAYEVLMDAVARGVPTRTLAREDLQFVEADVPGDLGRKVDPEQASTHLYANPAAPQARFVSDNRVFTNGRLIEFECVGAPDVTCVVFGDSFSYMMVPFLAESFRKVVFAHIATFDFDLMDRVRPDVVITIMNERFLIKVPLDLTAPTLAQWEEKKRAQGDMYPPREYLGNRIDSPAPPEEGWPGGG